MKRRLLAGFAAMAMAFSLAACNNGGNSGSTGSGGTSSGGSTASEEPTTIVWFWREGGDIQVPEDSYICKYIQEQINVKYIHSTPIGQTVEERLTAMLATGDVPDIAESWSDFTTKLKDYEAIIPVDDIIAGDQLSNVKNNQYMFDEAYSFMKRSDGNTWAIPATFASLNGAVPYIRYDWLENLGLDVPETFEELADVLAAFTKNDPDGNGQDDTWGTSYGGAANGFAENFGASPTGWYFTEDGGLEWGLFTDRMQPYMEYMRGLVESGGMNEEVADPEEFGTKHSNNIKAGKLGFSFGWNTMDMNDDIRKFQPDADFRPMPPPKGVYDVGYLPMGGIMRQEYVIFKKSQDEGRLDAALKLMNFLADDGGDQTKVDWDAPYWPANYGEKGVNWDVVDGVFQTNANNEEIKKNNEGKDYLNGRCKRWRTVSSQIGMDTGLTEAQKKANEEIATYPLISDIPQEPGYPLFVEGAESPSGFQEFAQNFNTSWSTYWMNSLLGQVDIATAIESARNDALSYGYEQQKANVIELYKQLGILK